MTTLSYVVLVALALQPRSGYDLTRWLAEVASHFWSARHSSIYPTLGALEREGLVEHEAVPSERGPVRKVFHLTERGHEVLLAWVDSPTDPPRVRDEQLVKVLCYGLLPRDLAVARLRAARARHQEVLDRFEQIRRQLAVGDGRPAPDRLGPLLTLLCGLAIERGYVAWCDDAVALLETGRMPPPELDRETP